MEVARRIPVFTPGSRMGPIAVDQGRYWVRVDELLPARAHALETIRDRVVQAIMLERRRSARSEAMHLLRARYEIRMSILPEVEQDS